MTASSNFGKFVAGALVGGAVGAVIGMLLAPRSGVETRAMIKEEFESRSRDAADTLREKSDILKEKAAALREDFRGKFSEVAEEVEGAGRRVISRFTDKKSSDASESAESAT